MIAKNLFTATLLALSVSAVHAAEASASASASVSVPVDAKSAKAAAAATAEGARNAAMSAGMGAIMAGKDAKASAVDAAKAAADHAGHQGMAMKDAAMAQGQSKMSAGQEGVSKVGALAGQVQIDAAKRISLKDRAALAKHFGVSKAIGKVFGNPSKQDLPAGYEGKLTVDAKLDAKLAAAAIKVDAATVADLGPQPKGSELLLIGKKVVRIDSSTQVILDVTPI